MKNNQFMELLNENLLENQRIFKLNSAVLNKDNTLNLVFIIDARTYDEKLDNELRDKVARIAADILPKIFRLNITYKKTITEPKYIIKAILHYVYAEFPTIYSFVQNSEIDVDIQGAQVNVTLYAEKYIYKFCQNSNLDEKLAEMLSKNYMEDFSVNIVEIANKTEIEILTQAPREYEGVKLIDITIKETLCGNIGKNPRYILEMKDTETEKATLCGVVSGFRERNYKEKEGCFYTFSLNDTTSAIEVKFFPRNDKQRQCGKELQEGDILVIEGPLRYDKFSRANALTARSIARCSINYDSINTKPKYKTAGENYINIHPAPYLNEEQKSLFATDLIKEKSIFHGKRFVVFDVETTGISATDKITEIGAVKIIDGEIAEIFQTLVNPQIPLTEEITKLTGITNEMLKDAPLFEDVVHDFYKFTQDSKLVAHNAPFDMSFIIRQGKEACYDFDKEHIDTLVLARQTVKSRSYKLGDLCKKLDIRLDMAHRAMSDALATANLFKKLLIMSANT